MKDQKKDQTISLADGAQDSKFAEMPRRHGPAHATNEDGHREPIYLPDELILQILSYIPRQTSSQQALASCSKVSHQWYRNSIPLLYHSPSLYGHNFDPFVRTIVPFKNLSVGPSPLATHVRVLDLSSLVHQANKSTTARLLGRTKAGLRVFVAPQRGFAMNSFPALAKAANLHTLDLSLVSESPPLPDLFKALAHLESLRTFRLPRSAGFGVQHNLKKTPPSLFWPPNLKALTLSGGIDAHFLRGVVAFPTTLTSMTIEHCPTAKGFAITHLLRNAVATLPLLKKLKLAHLPRLSGHALDGVLFMLPRLESLSVSVDYITPAIFDEGHFGHVKEPLVVPSGVGYGSQSPLDSVHSSEAAESPDSLALRTLELTYSGTPADIADKISPLDIMIAIDEGTLPHLRQVRVASSLMWSMPEAESLSDSLAEKAALEGGKKEGGVWTFDG